MAETPNDTEHRYRLLVEHVSDYAIFMLGTDGRVASWNDGAQRILGFADHEIVGQPGAVIFTPEDRDRGVPEQELATAARDGRATDERWHLRKDGSRFYASGVMTAVRDEAGTLIGFAKLMRDGTERKLAKDRLVTEHAVSRVLAEAATLTDAIPAVLEAVCRTSDWEWGGLWAADEHGPVLRWVAAWHDPAFAAAAAFADATHGARFARGVGLPGRVWASGEPAWVTDVAADDNFPRRAAAIGAGLRGALCFPVWGGGRVLGVVEFFSRAVRPPDPALLDMMAGIGRQVGQFALRRRAEEQLAANEARHRAVLDAALDAIVSMDHTGRVTEWNPAAERTFGYPAAEAVGREMADLIIPPQYRDAHRAGLAKYLATGEGPVVGRRFEITAVRRDGTEFPVELAITRLPTDGPPAFTGHLRDISEQKRADEARRMVESRFQRLVEHSPLSTQLFWPDGRTRQVNAAFTRLFGITMADLHDYSILRDPQLVRTSIMPLVERAFAGEAVVVDPIPYVPDRGEHVGQTRWAGAHAYAVKDDAGRVEEVVLVHFDVTKQRRAEQALREGEARFRQLAETIPQLAWVARPDGHIYWYNRRWYEYTGTTPEQMEGWGWQRVHDPAVLPAVLERWKLSIATGQPFEMEFPLRSADGAFRPFLTRVAPLRDEAGAVAQWFGTNTDVADQRRAAEERERLLSSERAARVEAERQGRMKDEFLATLSHELRTPLNAILGWSQVLRAGAAGNAEDLRQGLETIERNARAQARIIEDLLEMSRIISGKLRLDVHRVPVTAAVEAAVETVRHAADAKGVRLQVVLDPRAGPVSGDPARLQQVFWNLISNAVKFTPRGGRVQVLLERVNSHLEVSVTDSGEGIRPDFLPYVFDRFRQSDASTTRRHGGLGLGLSIVKQLVELHGGSVRAKSAGVGQGSTFTVLLPLIAIHSTDPAEPAGVDHRHPSASPSLEGLADTCADVAGVRVLVVDDEPDARALVKRLLEDCEAVVTTAGSTVEAMALLTKDPPDVLVSDIGMPGEDGYDLIRKVRTLEPTHGGSVPAIALTAYARAEDRVRAVVAGFQMHVAKPVEPAELIAMVASLAGKKRG